MKYSLSANYELFDDETIKVMVSLNLVSYPSINELFYAKEPINLIYESNDNYYGSKEDQIIYEKITYKNAFEDIESYAKSKNQTYVLNQHLLSDVVYNYSYTNYLLDVEKLGQLWLEYETKDEYILVFRGSYSEADFSNVLIFGKEWLFNSVDESTYNLYRDLYNNLNLTLDIDEPTKSDLNKFTMRLALNAESTYSNTYDYTDDLKKYIPESTKSEWNKYGYYLIIKKIIDDIVSSGKLLNKKVYITGHSQGGYHSQIASAYLSSKYKIYADVITFNSIGTKCTGRFTELGISESEFEKLKILNIKDPYDHYVAMDQTYGKSCYYDILYKPTIMKYCKSSAGKDGFQTQLMNPYKDNFYRCRYLTHNIYRIYDVIYKQGEFNRTSNINCSYRNETTTCINDEYSLVEAGIIIGIVILIMLIISIIVSCIRVLRKKKE